MPSAVAASAILYRFSVITLALVGVIGVFDEHASAGGGTATSQTAHRTEPQTEPQKQPQTEPQTDSQLEPPPLPGAVIAPPRPAGAGVAAPQTDAAAVTALPWLTVVNLHRALAGLPPAIDNPDWRSGIELHGRYCLMNNLLAHPEDPNNPWYTAEGHAAGTSSNLSHHSNHEIADHFMIDSWMQAPFHALGILDPRLIRTGYGVHRIQGKGAVAGLDVIRGRGVPATPPIYPVFWPGRDTTLPLPYGQPCPPGTICHWGEYPAPVTSCPGYAAPTGLPLIVQFGAGNVVPNVTASSFSVEGAPVEHCVFNETTFTNPDPTAQSLGRSILNLRDAVVLLPRAPLAGGKSYTASLTVNGQTHTWTFDIEAPPDTDEDSDGLPTAWETRFGLNAASATGADGATGDPDGDGKTNAEELAAGTHPVGRQTRYLAEGAGNSFFSARLAFFNPTPRQARVLIRFMQPGGSVATTFRLLAPHQRLGLEPATVPGVTSDFATTIESDEVVVVDRTMEWDASGYGSHAETSVASPATTWYLAEGSTSGDFSLFYLLQNPNPSPVTATIRYLRAVGQPPITRPYSLPGNSRTTIPIDDQGPELASTDVSGVVTATGPIIVERAMYRDRPGRAFAAGHESAGVTAPATEWFLAEGATGPFFDLFILLANPNAQDAAVTVDYLLLDGRTLTKNYTVPANQRFTIWVDDEQIPAGSGLRPLDNVAVSSMVRSTNGQPIIVERTMWWPSPAMSANFWDEAHNSPGATSTGTVWALAEGEVGGPRAAETYILIASTSTTQGSARVTLYFEDGTSTERTFPLLPRSRTNINVSTEFPQAIGKRFGTIVESLGSPASQIVVERAMYTSPGGVAWSAGTNALGTRLGM